MQKKYFALQEPKKLCLELEKYISNLAGGIGYASAGLPAVWRRNIQAYYGNIIDTNGSSSSLSFEGEQGELIKMTVPQARSVFRQFVGLITKQRLDFKSIAKSTDAKTLESARLGDAVIDNLVKKERLDTKAERLTEEAGICGSAFLKCGWRSDKGVPRGRDPDTGMVHYTGDVSIEVCSADDVLFDYKTVEFSDLDWVIIRTKKNKWDLIAQYPNLEEEILKIPSIDEANQVDNIFFGSREEYHDIIYVYEFYHRDTPAVAGGRFTSMASPDCIFTDGPNEYGFIPLEPMIPEKILFTGLGYPFFSNLLPLQEVLDATLSIIATNQQAFGIQSILTPRGSDLEVNDIGPLKFLTYTPQNANGGGIPQALQLTSTPPEVFKFIDVIMKNINDLSLVSSVLRGQPPQGVTAASAIATLSANSLQSLEGFSKALSICLENTMTKCVQIYQKFADVPKIVEICGPNKSYVAKEFVGKDLENVARIEMTISNPMAATAGGRQQIAQDLIKLGMVRNPDQYFTVLKTGNLDVMFDSEVSQQIYIESENDLLREGKSPTMVATDDHARHILCHSSVLNDPVARQKGVMVEPTLKHIQEHLNAAKQSDPWLTAMLLTGKMPQGAPPPPQGGMAEPPPGQPGVPEGEIETEGPPPPPEEGVVS